MALIIKRSSQFVETTMDEEQVVMNVDSGEFFSLAETGKVIWGLIDGTCGRDALLAKLALAYDAPDEELAADLDAFLKELAAAGLIEEG